jgi:hypothetical protein
MLLRDELKPVLILLGAVVVGLTIREIKLHDSGARQSAVNVETTERVAVD